MFKRAYALALAAAVLTVGCNETTKDSSSASSSTVGGAAATTATPSAPAAGAAATEKVHKLPSGLQYVDVLVGSGTMAEVGMGVSIHYTGYLTNGEKFDSSLDRGQPLRFQIGDHTMIAGFDEGVKGMRIGGKRKLTVPPDMGYGAAGRPPQIPPNSTLVFDVELVDVK